MIPELLPEFKEHQTVVFRHEISIALLMINEIYLQRWDFWLQIYNFGNFITKSPGVGINNGNKNLSQSLENSRKRRQLI